MSATIPCGICPGEIALGATTCPGCGRPVTDTDRSVLQVRLEGGDFAAHERGRRVRGGSKWIGALAILFAISSPIVFFMQKSTADDALAKLDSALGPEEEAEAAEAGSERSFQIEGKTYTASELRRAIKAEPVQALVANLVLAVIMGVLWIWARRAPLPAIACALAVFVVVQLVSAVLKPETIYQGILIKIIAIGGLVQGLRAALAAREAMRRPIA